MLLENIVQFPYYHGTSSNLGIGDTLLPPNSTDKISELGRKKNLDKVFFTRDYKSAEIYAKKAVKRFGGDPVVFLIKPIGDLSVVQDMPGTTVFMADTAEILDVYNVDTQVRKHN
jgi:DNA/RNA tunnel of bacterial DNA dependent RNA polymerase.